jgi:TRAP-type C4-dicarboxylate transport system substrate-binding protein
MKGLKMRVMPSPVFRTLVESLGASPSAIPWAELPTALQQKVVDGQENGVTNILAASLYQYQKYITLDGHVWSVHGYLINEPFFQGLTAAERKALEEGTQKAIAIHRKMTSDQDKTKRSGKVGTEAPRLWPPRSPSSAAAQPPVNVGREGDRQGVRGQPLQGDRGDAEVSGQDRRAGR